MNETQRAALELRLGDLKKLVAATSDLGGLLLAACSAHEPDADLQRRVIRYLVKAGADVHERDKNGVTPLHRAVRFRSPDAVDELIRLGSDVNAIDRRTGSTPLHRAVTNTGAPTTAGTLDEAVEIAKLLLSNGADPKKTNKNGRTPTDCIESPRMQVIFVAYASS